MAIAEDMPLLRGDAVLDVRGDRPAVPFVRGRVDFAAQLLFHLAVAVQMSSHWFLSSCFKFRLLSLLISYSVCPKIARAKAGRPSADAADPLATYPSKAVQRLGKGPRLVMGGGRKTVLGNSRKTLCFQGAA